MENYEEYKAFTAKRNWRGIFELNNVKFDGFGTKKELQVLHEYLEKDEVVFAMVSGVMSQTQTSNSFDFGTNTWIAALTNERFLCLDCAMLTSSVDTQSIRLENVQAVSASQGWMLGKVIIDLGSRTVVIDNCLKDSVSIMASLANKLIKENKAVSKENSSRPILQPVEMNPVERLEALHKLHKFQVISDAEYVSGRESIIESRAMIVFKEMLLAP